LITASSSTPGRAAGAGSCGRRRARARVVFIPQAGFREARSWMVCGETGDTPWEGRDRLAPDGAPPARLELIENDDRLTLESTELTVEIGLSPLALRWHRAAGALFAADRPSRAYGFGRHRPDLLHAMARHPEDCYYGLGDKTGPLDLRGRRLRTVMTDALGFDPRTGDPLYKHWPFLIVRDGATGGFTASSMTTSSRRASISAPNTATTTASTAAMKPPTAISTIG
jgi:alpha-glucosidase